MLVHASIWLITSPCRSSVTRRYPPSRMRNSPDSARRTGRTRADDGFSTWVQGIALDALDPFRVWRGLHPVEAGNE